LEALPPGKFAVSVQTENKDRHLLSKKKSVSLGGKYKKRSCGKTILGDVVKRKSQCVQREERRRSAER